MAEYLVTDTDMISLADTIRTKGGTSSPLSFPNGMKSAVNAIPSGGSSTTKAAISMFCIETSGSYTIHTTYDATIGNSIVVDEDGNTYDGTNGKFQYALWNGGSPTNWVDIEAGTINNPAPIIALRFVNTDNNKPFICCGSTSEWTGSSGITELYITPTSGNFRYGVCQMKPVPEAFYVDVNIYAMYNAAIGQNFQFDWVIAEEID